MRCLLLFTYKMSLEFWDKAGILSREVLLYKKLVSKGIKYKLLTYGDLTEFKYKETLRGLEILPIGKLVKSRFKPVKLLKSMFLPVKLKKDFKKVDIIKTNQIEGSWVAFLAKILYGKKFILRAGFGWFRNYINMPRKKGLTNYIKYLTYYCYIFILEFLAYKLSDIIMISNESDIDFVIKTFKIKNLKDKIKLLPNFVDTYLFKPQNINKKEKSVLFIGRLSVEKNLLNLLKAIKELQDFNLDIIGDGPNANKLKNLANRLKINVKFLGIIPNNKLPSIINQYCIFILPSIFEGNPKSLLEAMSCGIPCIGTNVRGIKNIIIHENNGYLCDISSISIKKAILELYNNASLREKISKLAREFVISNYALDSVIEKEYLIYKNLLR